MNKELWRFDESKVHPTSANLTPGRLISSTKEFAQYLSSDSQETPVFSPSVFDVETTAWKEFLDLYLQFPLTKPLAAKAGRDVRLDWLDQRHANDFLHSSDAIQIESAKGPEPRFSFVIPFRNRPETVTRVLSALGKMQTDDAFEVVLVNDGSTAESLAAIRAALKTVPFSWTIATLPDSSIFRAGIARNFGASHARAEILVFLDSDILVGPDFPQRLTEALALGDIAQARRWQIWRDQWSTADGLDLSNLVEPNSFWSEFQRSSTSWMQLTHPWKYVSTFCLGVRKKDLLDIGGFRLWYSDYGFEDTDIGLRLHRQGRSFQKMDADVFHLSQLLSTDSPEKGQRERLRRSARKYFLINQALDSLDWLIYLML